MEKRRETKQVMVGPVPVGGGAPVAIQSMTNTRTADADATTAQILALEEAGCEIVRAAVPDREAAEAFRLIRPRIHIPLVADIHFDYRLAIAAMECGADKIRINPGNIGGPEKIREVAACARERSIPIRVGVNGGSLEKDILRKYGGVTAQGLVESALDKVHMIEDAGYGNLVVSIKSSDVPTAVDAHLLLADRTDYPIHVGITEAGTVRSGTVVSAVGLGAILSRGIGDTVRVSLTGDPVQEIWAARKILQTLGLRKAGVRVISCPTCGRTSIDLIRLAGQVEEMTAGYDLDIDVAVMGCVVNGPGEAREADIGIAGGKGEGLLISHGEIIGKYPEEELLAVLKDRLDHWGE